MSELNKQKVHVDPVLPNHTPEEIKDLQMRVAGLAISAGFVSPLDDEARQELRDIFHALGIGYKVDDDKVEVILSPGEGYFSGLQLSYLRNLLTVREGNPTGHFCFLMLDQETADNSNAVVDAMVMLNDHMTTRHVTFTLDPNDPKAVFMLPHVTHGTKLIAISIEVDDWDDSDYLRDY